MKIVFLDIDGPLISMRMCYLPEGGGIMDVPDVVSGCMINSVCEEEEDEIKIVLSSTWRYKGYMKCLNLLNRARINADKFMFNAEDEHWRTGPDGGLGLSDGYSRSREIQTWLDNYREKLNVTEFLIIDDETMHPDINADHALKVDGYNGIMFQDVKKMKRILIPPTKEELEKEELLRHAATLVV